MPIILQPGFRGAREYRIVERVSTYGARTFLPEGLYGRWLTAKWRCITAPKESIEEAREAIRMARERSTPTVVAIHDPDFDGDGLPIPMRIPATPQRSNR